MCIRDRYDSIHGRFPGGDVAAAGGSITVNGKSIKVLSEKDPAELPWKDLGVEVVVESTGLFTIKNDGVNKKGKQVKGAVNHIAKGGAKKVIISAPAEGEDLTIVLGVNEGKYDPKNHHVVSNASCTTNCLAPVAKVLNDTWGIEKGLMTTIHAYTNDQNILDLPHKDLRRARAAAMSMIPTTTGAARATALVLPALKGKIEGMAIRVPTPNVSLVDLVVETEKETSIEEVNQVMKKASENELKGILEYCELPLVSRDFNGSSASSTLDAPNTNVIGGNMVKVLTWYDNEWGYSHRVVDLVNYVAKKQ